MKVLIPLLATAAVASAASMFQQIPGVQSPISTLSTPVPGENPLNYCGDTGDDILTIENVTLEPNPPLPGQTLHIKATGFLKERIEAGAYVHVEVKYGYIKLVNQNIDLCENADQVNLKCPVEAGKLELSKDVDLPKAIPPGKYHVIADVYNADDTPITCLTADVFFKPGGGQ